MSLIEPTTKTMVLMFTDLVGSVDLKTRLGANVYARIISRHDQLFKQILGGLPGSRTIKDTGDGFLARFDTASDAVQAALRFQYVLHQEKWEPEDVFVRIGLHIGQVAELEKEDATGQPKLVGLAADIAARVMDLSTPGQILMTRTLFDDARQYIREHPSVGASAAPELKWMAHGPYLFKGSDEPMDVFEVGAVGIAPLKEPPDSNKAKRAIRPGEEDLFGWRPAIGLAVPGREGWCLDRKLGEGGFGEVWLAKHHRIGESRVFKFCFDADRLRSFKREMTLFRLLREALGDRKDIARLWEVRLDKPPFYLESAFSKEGDLSDWIARQGGPAKLSREARIEIIAKIADATAAAHSVGVLHKDIKPANILIHVNPDGSVQPMLADFGIGVVTDRAQLDGRNITMTGFTESLVGGNESSRTGTRLYAPPEMLTGKPFTTKGDVYALGVMLYQLIIGDLGKPLAHGWESEIDDPLLREDIALYVAGEESQRLGSASELATRLRTLPQRRAERRRQQMLRTSAIATAALAVLLIVAGFLVLRERGLRGEADKQREEATNARNQSDLQRKEIAGLLSENQSRLVRLFVEKGWRESNRDIRRSLLWFVDALQHDPPDPHREWMHRIRIATTLRQSPRIDRAWVAPGYVHGGTLSADHQRLALLSLDGEGFVMDLQNDTTTALPMKLGQHSAITPDGQRVVTISAVGGIELWDSKTGKVASSPIGNGPDERTLRLLMSPTGDRIVTFDGTHRIRLRQVSDLKLIATIEHASEIRSGAFSPDGSLLVTASADRTAGIWNAATGERIGQAIAHPDEVRQVLFIPDGSIFLTAGVDGIVRFFDAKAGKLLAQIDSGGAWGMAIDPAGKRLAIDLGEKQVAVWNLENGSQLGPPRTFDSDVFKMVFSPDGKMLVATTSDSMLWFWPLDPMAAKIDPIKLDGYLSPLAFTKEGKLLVVSNTGMIRRFDCQSTAQPMATMRHLPVSSQPDDAPGADEPRPNRRRISGPLPSGSPVLDEAPPMMVTYVSLSAKGDRIATSSLGGQVTLWSRDGKPAMPMFPFKQPVEYVELSPDGTRMLTVTDYGVAHLWNLSATPASGQRIVTASLVHAARFDPKGEQIATADDFGNITIWNAGDLQKRLGPIPGEPIADIAFTADGRHLLVSHQESFRIIGLADGAATTPAIKLKDRIAGIATGPADRIGIATYDGHAHVFGLDGKLVCVTTPAEDGTNQLVFSPDGTRIATSSGDAARVWDANTGKPVSEKMEHAGYVIGIDFSGDGRLLATACDDGTARIWNAATGEPITPPLRHTHPAIHTRFLPDGKTLLTVAGEAAFLWDYSPDSSAVAELGDLARLQAGAMIDPTLSVVPLSNEGIASLAKKRNAKANP